ncbi:MAG: hypothetical protein NTZ49_00285 [Candidatus Parcubacteria bacterium]|nr:hypothetical protein [Candidatus Parcubacteria bacterium]
MANDPRTNRVFKGNRPRIRIIGNEVRCDCGTLFCKVVTGDTSGIEIKCRRCKRLIFIPCQIDLEISIGKEPNKYLDERCDCGNLLGRFLGNKLEIKCRHCKALIIIPAKFPEDYLARKR